MATARFDTRAECGYRNRSRSMVVQLQNVEAALDVTDAWKEGIGFQDVPKHRRKHMWKDDKPDAVSRST